jgi:hypothetical protein
MPMQTAEQALETLVSESPDTSMLILFNTFSCWMSETLPSTLPQWGDHIIQAAHDMRQHVDTLIRQVCDDQGNCSTASYRRRAQTPDRARPPGVDSHALTQSIVHNLKQRSREEALDYLAALIGGWCLCCPTPFAQRYLISGQDPTDAGMARSLLAWMFRPLDFWS